MRVRKDELSFGDETSEMREHQKKALSTAIYPVSAGKSYTVLGLAAEAGELAGKFAKYYRGDYEGVPSHEKSIDVDIMKELFDVYWFVLAVAYEFDIDLDVMLDNGFNKLNKRKNENKLKGDGDDR